MRFSTFHIFPCPPDRPPRQVLEETAAEIEVCEALGFHAAWLTEHHDPGYGLCTSPSVLAAFAAARTHRLLLGYAVNVAPLHHPARLAEDLALVDQLSGGRVVAGFGSGYSPPEYALHGVPFAERHERFREALDIVLGLWSGEDFTYQGQYYQVRDARLALRPLQKPHPPVAVTAGRPESIEAVARRGWRLLVLGGPEEIRARIDTYAAALRRAGHAPEKQAECLQTPGALCPLFATRNPAKDRPRLLEVSAWHLRQLRRLAAPPGEEVVVTEEEVETYFDERITFGAPEKIAARIQSLREAGVGEILGWFKWGTMTHAEATASMRLFAEEVMPAFS